MFEDVRGKKMAHTPADSHPEVRGVTHEAISLCKRAARSWTYMLRELALTLTSPIIFLHGFQSRSWVR